MKRHARDAFSASKRFGNSLFRASFFVRQIIQEPLALEADRFAGGNAPRDDVGCVLPRAMAG
jgi:hypothetical protein